MKVIEPLGDHVIVHVTSQEEIRKAGSVNIIIPDVVKEKPWEGTVIAAGPGKRDLAGNIMPMSVKEGDTIICGRYAGNEIEIDHTKYLIMHEDEILGVIKEIQDLGGVGDGMQA